MRATARKVLLATLLIAPGAASAQHDHDHGTVEAVRVAVADGARNQIRIIDAATGDEAGSFTVPGETGGKLALSSSGTYLIAAHSDANRVSIIHSGLLYEDHGDHGHVLESAPHVVATLNVGRQPGNLTVAGDEILVFNAGDGSIAVLDENMFGLSLNHDYVDVAQPGSGVALSIGGFILAGLPDLARVDVHGPRGSLVESIGECPELSGAVAVGPVAFFNCQGSVLRIEVAENGISSSHSAVSGADRIDRFYGHAGDIAAGSLGVGLAFVHARSGEVTTMSLPATPIAADVTGDMIAVLTTAGSLHLIRIAEEGPTIIHTVDDLMDPATTAGQPDLAVHGASIYVSEPAAGNLISLEVTGDEVHIRDVFAVGGNPADIEVLVVGGEVGHDH